MLTATAQSGTEHGDSLDTHKAARQSSDVSVLPSRVAIHTHIRGLQMDVTFKHHRGYELPRADTLSSIKLTMLSIAKLLPDALLPWHKPKESQTTVAELSITPTLAEGTDCACQGCWAEVTTLSAAVFEHRSTASPDSTWAVAAAKSGSEPQTRVPQSSLGLPLSSNGVLHTDRWVPLRASWLENREDSAVLWFSS